jgi:hypothetical protein
VALYGDEFRIGFKCHVHERAAFVHRRLDVFLTHAIVGNLFSPSIRYQNKKYAQVLMVEQK